MRIEARRTGDGSPVDVGRAQLCGVAGAVGICLDAMLLHGDADLGPLAGGTHAATTSYAGLTLGVAKW